jgi:hypothetical protein
MSKRRTAQLMHSPIIISIIIIIIVISSLILPFKPQISAFAILHLLQSETESSDML